MWEYFYVLGFAILSILGMFLCILLYPQLHITNISINTFWIPPLIGGLIILIYAGYDNFFRKITEDSSLNPLKILALFISISFISIVLDESSFFQFLASAIVQRFKSSQLKLFIILYSMISVLTIFTSNDIVILTFTPFILYLSNKGNINPIPYLVMEFVSANTYSLVLEIGNPTNIFLSGAYSIPFLEYTARMVIPTIVCGALSFLTIFLLFRKDLQHPIEAFDLEITPIADKIICLVSGITLILTTLLLAISNYIHFEMYIISGAFALALLLFLIVYAIIRRDIRIVVFPLTRIPYNLVPFVLSMFAIIMGINKLGLFEDLGKAIAKVNSSVLEAVIYLVASTLSCNIVNNIPMTLAYQYILQSSTSLTSVYATIMGSNIGALLTPIGALAGIMWLKILKDNGVDYSFVAFMKNGSLITCVCLVPLAISLIII